MGPVSKLHSVKTPQPVELGSVGSLELYEKTFQNFKKGRIIQKYQTFLAKIKKNWQVKVFLNVYNFIKLFYLMK